MRFAKRSLFTAALSEGEAARKLLEEALSKQYAATVNAQVQRKVHAFRKRAQLHSEEERRERRAPTQRAIWMTSAPSLLLQQLAVPQLQAQKMQHEWRQTRRDRERQPSNGGSRARFRRAFPTPRWDLSAAAWVAWNVALLFAGVRQTGGFFGRFAFCCVEWQRESACSGDECLLCLVNCVCAASVPAAAVLQLLGPLSLLRRVPCSCRSSFVAAPYVDCSHHSPHASLACDDPS